ncbi:MAG: hypothetical protein J5545_02125 [Bacteroidaceae bacterium]|nr:hypothetical protein [Bacteroidaceae bacterium]
MKTFSKLAMAIMLLVGAATQANADVKLSIEDFAILDNGSIKTVSVLMNNDEAVTNFQFEIKLPAGLSISDVDKGSRLQNGHRARFNDSPDGDNTYRVLVTTSNNSIVKGNEGEVLTIDFYVDGELQDPSEITIKNVFATDENATDIKIIPSDPVKVTIAEPQLLFDADPSSFSVLPGNTETISIAMTNDIKVNSFVATIKLPKGLSIVNGIDDFAQGERIQGGIWIKNEETETSEYSELIFSYSPNSGKITIRNANILQEGDIYLVEDEDEEEVPFIVGNNILFSFEVTADETLDAEATIELTDITINNKYAVDPISITVYNTAKQVVELTDDEIYDNENDIQVAEVVYTRNFKNTNWQALYLPFEVKVADIANDFEVAYINAIHQYDDDEDGNVDRTTLEWFYQRDGVIRPNDPTYLIRAKEAGVKSIKATDVTLKAAAENEFSVSTRTTTFTFYGTYDGIDGEEVPGFWAFAGGTVKQAATEAATLKPYRWYMLPSDRDAEVKNIECIFTDGEATGIQAINNKVQDHQMFDLTGRRVNGASKGLYIINGKKIIKK